MRNLQSVGAFLPHDSAWPYDSVLVQEEELCVQGYESNAAMIHPRRHGDGRGEGAADENAAGAAGRQCLRLGDLLKVLRRLTVKIPYAKVLTAGKLSSCLQSLGSLGDPKS